MDNKIDNKLAFNIYLWFYFSIYVLVSVYLIIIFLAALNKDTALFKSLTGYYLPCFVLIIFSRLFDYLIQPAYFESQISNGQIRFKSFNQNRNNIFRFFLMPFEKRHLIEQTINQQSYNNYILNIDRFGFRKYLILQKLENGKLYQSTPINISFLSIRKYTNLILSIDRLQEKITLN